ncbi:hypothetical protein A1O7_01830 [Cladophialophora yegresii CBS 114405]|uniref:Uncharacterized protein n=1 Tax=Cladophialophora yegresii CBS 114405 TaxID=1182544 RepID=W9X4V7_9EURO|nr:uncharacterized protein A1O7_01830 [Cladophialophora yegresii CBS 114405]EXJ65489.1 hypothetical protein A1O7_01830 [Cladophialophora yegresii CBS 114405]
MDNITVFQLPRHDQRGSCLFDTLPGEVRDRICTFALNCYESTKLANKWDIDSSYVRPGYRAPHVADTALLRTCQRVYTENWFRPWVSATHTFYLAWVGRRPDDRQRVTVEEFQPCLDRLCAAHGPVEIAHVRLFAQLCYLEDGDKLSAIMGMNHFFPRKITVTIRHHDWWSWERDWRLCINSAWVEECRFPDSLQELCVELESLQRKKDQVDWMARRMAKKWHFKKRDGSIMSAAMEDCKVSSWSGSSTWEGERWLRDETKLGVNEYYVKTITWRPDRARTLRPRPEDLTVPSRFPAITDSRPFIHIWHLRRAGIPLDLSPGETLRLAQEWEARWAVEADVHYVDEGMEEEQGEEDEDEQEQEEEEEEEEQEEREQGEQQEAQEEEQGPQEEEQFEVLDESESEEDGDE